MRYLLYKLPGTQVALLGLLPRGSKSYDYSQPSLFTAATNRVNAQLK